ncbi:uncharacterized protein EDB91DRAFT_1111125 [Suillus paluster]|uniref:uncharacterized protein n=1 Tax=Suillus paluster TaxID=48578 RepID=UPI001B880711|nr:uncharacterized protein EDB91DRAFT_1111125 [Suillus paluster]KAG1748834.1 hypothetical protein EDB91DRAFT_1111125 [Suillus paluster]
MSHSTACVLLLYIFTLMNLWRSSVPSGTVARTQVIPQIYTAHGCLPGLPRGLVLPEQPSKHNISTIICVFWVGY